MKNKIIHIVCTQEDYDAWKRGEMLCDMKRGGMVEVPVGMKLRNKVFKSIQKEYGEYRFFIPPESWEELSKSEKLQGALTYEEFKEMTEHVSKKIINNIVSLVVVK